MGGRGPLGGSENRQLRGSPAHRRPDVSVGTETSSERSGRRYCHGRSRARIREDTGGPADFAVAARERFIASEERRFLQPVELSEETV